MKTMNSAWEGKCCVCGKAHFQGTKIGYDPDGERGKKAFCLDCAGLTEDQKKAMPAVTETTVTPRPVKPTPTPATMDLAALIAAAVSPLVQGQLDEARVVELIQAHSKPMAHTITVKTPEIPQGVDMGRQHKQFEELLVTCSAKTKQGRLNVWITGPAGSGKTTAAENVAIALGLKYAVYPTMKDTYGFFGFIAPGTGKYSRTLAREIWEFGGMLILDDFDGTPADTAIELNAPFANGSCTFPDAVVPRHPDCLIILTANTWGTGATNDYVGRAKQDSAFTDRFAFIDWEYDEMMELDTCPIREWAVRVQQVRQSVKAKGMKVLITPRASYYGAALLAAGMDQAKVEAMVLRKSMTADQWRSVC